MFVMTVGPWSFALIASAVSALVSMLTIAHQTAPEDPIQDLTFRLRSPWTWRLAHPVRAIMRAVNRPGVKTPHS